MEGPGACCACWAGALGFGLAIFADGLASDAGDRGEETPPKKSRSWALHGTHAQDLLLGPGQQWRNYFVCAETGAAPCLAQSLGAEGPGAALPQAASRALVELAALPANSSEVVQVRAAVRPPSAPMSLPLGAVDTAL